MKRILITGGAGYIGSHTCLHLLESGFRIYVIDSLENSAFESLSRINQFFKDKNHTSENKIKFFKGDIRDKDSIKIVFEDAIRNNQIIDAVIHFAGLKAVSESEENPIKYWEYNVLGSINLFEVMELYSCRKIVFSSSASVYGEKHKSPIKEDNILIPSNVYGRTKKTIEEILVDLHFSKKWKIAILRYFNPVGAHESGLIGENPISNRNNLFPILCDVARKKTEKLLIYGSDWPTRDGTCIRDYLHVHDLVVGHKIALDYLLNSIHEFIKVNLGTGKGTSILEFIKTFENVNKVKINYEFSEKRLGDCAVLFSDCNLAKLTLNWETSKTLNDICRDGWKWVINNPNGFTDDLEKLDLSIYNEI